MREEVAVLLEEDGGPAKSGLFATALLRSVAELPFGDALGDLGPGVSSLGAAIDGDNGGGEDAAIVIAAGLRTVLIDGAGVVAKHRALAAVVVAEQLVALGKSSSFEEQGLGDALRVSVSWGRMWMNMDQRQQPRHSPQGTSVPAAAPLSDASVARSHEGNYTRGGMIDRLHRAGDLDPGEGVV